jgi:peroxiredoxin
MSTEQSLTQPAHELPTYEQLLQTAHDPALIAHYRATVVPELGYGDPQVALQVGDPAPPFRHNDQNGTAYDLPTLLRHGPVVLTFYRGGWCPFCNVQLRAFQLVRSQLRALKATLLLISPAVFAETLTLIEREALQFPLITDHGNQLARQYGVAFAFDPKLRERHLAQGVNLAELNSAGDWALPLPATFVIDRQGIISYAHVSADYTQRVDPAAVLTALQRLRRR